jgi:hypothetical protein
VQADEDVEVVDELRGHRPYPEPHERLASMDLMQEDVTILYADFNYVISHSPYHISFFSLSHPLRFHQQATAYSL